MVARGILGKYGTAIAGRRKKWYTGNTQTCTSVTAQRGASLLKTQHPLRADRHTNAACRPELLLQKTTFPSVFPSSRVAAG